MLFRSPWILGCCATWTEESRAAHYQNLVAMEDRIVLAGIPRYVGGISYVVGEPDLDEQQLAQFVGR